MIVVTRPSDHLREVVVDLLVAEGWEGVSIRRVAVAAGVSIGAVQHHFATKDALLDAAMDLVEERFRERLEQRVPVGAPAAAVLREVADELLGADPEQRTASVVWLLRVARGAVHLPTAERHRAQWRDVEGMLTRLIAGSRPGLPEPACRDAAAALLALLDGLAVAAAVEPDRMPPARARALVAAHLDGLLTP